MYFHSLFIERLYFLIQTCCLSVINNNISFNFQRSPRLQDKLVVYLVYISFGIESPLPKAIETQTMYSKKLHRYIHTYNILVECNSIFKLRTSDINIRTNKTANLVLSLLIQLGEQCCLLNLHTPKRQVLTAAVRQEAR